MLLWLPSQSDDLYFVPIQSISGYYIISHFLPLWRKVGQVIYKVTGKCPQNSECEKTLKKLRDSCHTGLNQNPI